MVQPRRSRGAIAIAALAGMATAVQFAHAFPFLNERQEPEWKTIECSNPGVINAEDASDWRWDQVKASQAWDDVVGGWALNRTERPDSNFPFPRSVSNFFNGPEGMDCHKLIEANGCHGGSNLQCHDTNHPAGYFILNSFRNLEAFLWNLHSALSEVHESIDGKVGTLSSTFAPVKPLDQSFNIIMNFVLMGWGVAAAPGWNAFFRNLPVVSTTELHGSIKDLTNDMVKESLTMAKDLTGQREPALATQSEVSKQVTDIVELWKDTIVQFAEKLYNCEDENVQRLGRIISGGKMMSDETVIPTVTELRDSVSRSLYSQLIPISWKLSQQDINPFIMDLGKTCGERTDDKAFCFENRLYELRSVNGLEENCDGSTTGNTAGSTPGWVACPLPEPPGVEALGSDEWGGIAIEDIVVECITWKSNGQRNVEGPKDIGQLSDDELDSIATDIRANGVFALPVCGEEEARDGYRNGNAGGSYSYPCGTEYTDPRYKSLSSDEFKCEGSGMCPSAVNFVRNCDRAVNDELIRTDDLTYGIDANKDQRPSGGHSGNCKHDYQDIREKGGCGRCGKKFWGPNNSCVTVVNYAL
ncbi:hypothetical protein NCS52_01322800 [Fusarium sp. LHS14.1]|nr:hypothetical protein NCS52_01322800 [Fusarium sp. LHS14.1]